MANQIIIDIGAAANDGTGDPLRTAFNFVNNNFSNVWNTGLPDSNIAFSGNRILTVNTNGNLILAPNGIGKVVANVDIVPNANITHSLGALNRRWNTVYTQFIDVSGDVEFTDLTVNGNLTVIGNTIQIGNIVTDTKTIQLANTAVTANAANGSGITVGANDNIATMLYSSSANVWTTNIGISATGNISGTYFIGNGSLLTGIASPYGNSNVAAYLPTYTGNISANNVFVTNDLYSKRGSFSGDPVTGDASMYVGSPTFTDLGTDVMAQFTGNVTNYAQINLQNYGNSPTASGDYIITADNGNDTTHFLNIGLAGSQWDGTQDNSLGNLLSPNDGYFYVQDGNLVIGTKEAGNTHVHTWTWDTTGNVTAAGNLIPASNVIYSLGNATNRWANLWLSGNTIQLGDLSLSASANGLTSTTGFDLENSTAANITATGNITADYFLGNIEGLIGNITNLNTLNFDVTYISAQIGNNGVNIGAGGFNNLVVLPTEVTIQNVPLYVTSGNIKQSGNSGLTIGSSHTVYIVSDQDNNDQTWTFGDNGTLTVPGDITTTLGTATGNIVTNVRTWDSVGANLYVWFDANETPEIVELNTISGGNVNGWLVSVEGGNQALVTATNPAGYFSISTNQALTGSGNLTFTSPDYEPPAANPLTITVGGNDWTFDNAGTLTIASTITSDNQTTITAVDDVNIRGGNKVPGSTGGEGGDINISGGDGRIDNGTSTGSGGDVVIEGGYGGDAVNQGAASGGLVELRGGDGGRANAGNSIQAGPGGSVQIIGGSGGNNVGNTALSDSGGNVEIYGGTGSFDTANSVPSGAPGHVNLYGGNWGDVTQSGNITLNTYDGFNFKTLTYDNHGNVIMAAGGGLNFVGTNPGIVQSPDEDFYIRVQDADDDGFSLYQAVDDGDGNVLGQTRLQRDRFQIGFTNGSSPTFAFTESGETEIPGNIRTTDYADTSLYVVTDNSPSGSVELKTISYSGDVLGSNVRVTQSNATISTNNALYTWNFDNTGNLTLPLNGNIVGATPNNNGYLNWFGNSSGDGGGYTTMNIVPDDTRVGGDQYLIIDPTAPGHIHIRAGGTQDNSSAELYLGGENSYFKVDAGLNPDVFVAAAGERWQFSQGQLILANGNSIIQSLSSSSLDPLNPNVSTMTFTPDPGYGSQALVLDPTSVGHIHLRAPAASGNIDDPVANLFLGGEASSFEVGIGYGSAPDVYIHSNSNTWTFDTTGNLTVPGNINVSGSASPAPSINGFESASFVGNISGNYFIGNGSLLTGLASSYGNANVANFLAAYGSNTISTTGNITAGNFTGNITITGNVTGTSPNVELVAGSFTTTFDNTGTATFPGNISVTGNVITPNLPAFRVTGSGNTTNLSNTVNSTGNLNINNFTVDYNQGSYLNTSTGVFTAPVAGLYSVHLVARTSGNNDATSQIAVMKNGTTQQAFWEVSANSTVGHMGVSSVAKLAVGDTLVAKVLLGTINFDQNDSWSVAFLG